MSSPSVAFAPRRALPLAAVRPTQERERWTRRMVCLTWCLLLLNTLTFFPGLSFISIPGHIGKGISQGSLVVAFFLALAVNRHKVIRPNVFLCLTSLLVLGTLITALQPEHFGTVFRTFRLGGFIATLWLLTPWWGRRDLLLVRCHLTALAAALTTVVIGALIAPGSAFADGRLTGALWPIPPTQVAHYAATSTGLVLVLWLCGRLRGKITILIIVPTVGILLLTHTRTALVGLIAGVLVAGLSLIVAHTRVRRLFAILASLRRGWPAAKALRNSTTSLAGPPYGALWSVSPVTNFRRYSASDCRTPPSTAFPSTVTGWPPMRNKDYMA
jgi:hypothetical protein